jgi:hypothetical protein
VDTVNVGSRAPACPLFIVALCERGPTAIHDSRPRSGRGSDRFLDPEIRRSHSQHPVDRGVVFVHRGEGLLGQDVVKARCPLPGPQASGRRAVVHHEGHPTGVHEGVQSFRVHRLSHALVHDLRVGVPLLSQNFNLLPWRRTVTSNDIVSYVRQRR